MATRAYRIKSFVMETGERYCLLICTATGVPLFYPNLFLTTQVRNNSLSLASMESALAAINVFLAFCNDRQLNVVERFLQNAFLTPPELDALRDYCQLDFSRPDIEKICGSGSGRRKKNPSHSISSASEYTRLSHIAKYVRWLAETLLSHNLARQTAAEIAKMQKSLESRRPVKKGRNHVGRERGLTEPQLEVLLGIIKPGARENPFEDDAIQVRNQLIVLMLLHLGIRGGELLNIRISDIDWTRNQVVIARRADEKSDPRTDQPLVKTLDRRLPMKDTLTFEIHKYVVGHRNKVPGARKNDYLFVTHKAGPTQGQPMSRSSYIKVIMLIAGSAPSLENFRGHGLRHAWNDAFSNFMDQMQTPPSHADQEKQRSYLQGWKESSGTAATYTRRFTEAKAVEASLKLQAGISRVPRTIKNG